MFLIMQNNVAIDSAVSMHMLYMYGFLWSCKLSTHEMLIALSHHPEIVFKGGDDNKEFSFVDCSAH